MLKSSEQPQRVGAVQPGNVQVWGDLIVTFQYIKAACEKGRGKLLEKPVVTVQGATSQRDLDWT